MKSSLLTSIASLVLFTAISCMSCTLAGCERKEKVIDVETPAGDVEVERSLDTGRVDVEVEEP